MSCDVSASPTTRADGTRHVGERADVLACRAVSRPSIHFLPRTHSFSEQHSRIQITASEQHSPGDERIFE